MRRFAVRYWSLRRKLIVACVLVELAAMLMVLIGAARLMQRTLEEQATVQAHEIIAVLDQALVAPLVQRDYASVQQILDQVRDPNAFPYLVLFDHRDRLVASSGWDEAKPLPARDDGVIDLDRPDATLHMVERIRLAGQDVARLELGMSTTRLRQARDEFRATGALIALIALGVSVGLLAAISYALTRNLAKVSAASRKVAKGEFDIHVPVHTHDEVGQLATSFNRMVTMVQQRVAALQESRHQQQLHLAAARDERTRLTTLLGALRSGILFVDAQQRLLYTNVQFSQIWSLNGLAPGDDLGQIVPVLRQQVAPGSAALLDVLLAPGQKQAFADCEIALADGRLVSQRMQLVGDVDDASAAAGGCIWLYQDITLDRQTQRRARLALHDPLTDLLNRRGLFESLHAAIDRAADTHAGVTLLFLDLDDFKHANDVAGHRAGDQILVMVAHALAGQLQADQVVARLGGDEFAIICPAPENAAPDEGAVMAARLVQSISALQFNVQSHAIRVGCSIGVARYPVDATSADDLVACADRAMYQAKLGGKNGYCLYRDDAAYSMAEAERVTWNGRIYGALRDHRLELHFQPVHQVSDLDIVYYEALVRMVDEKDANHLIPPSEFVPHAERSGKIRQIDRWVFQTCIDKLAQSPSAVCIAANLSARSLDDPGFAPFLRDALQHHDVDPGRLHIELTETAAMGDLIAARPMIAALRSVGCAVHLDDFGSGFSSFAHLKLLEVDGIKIDGSFIRDLTSDPSNELVVASLIKIARSLNKTTVAECVEDAATLDALRELGVDHVQGFHLGRPSSTLAERRPKERLTVVTPLREARGADD